MRKRKYLVLTLALLSLAILGFTVGGFHVGLANPSSSVSTQKISTLGTISYPTYNPGNLALIPDDWGLTYGSGPQIIHLDYTVTHNGDVSIRLDAHTSNDVNTWRECDGTWYSVKPGDHVVAKVWIETSPSSLGDTSVHHGGRIGMDFYAHTSAGYGCVDGAGEIIGTTPPGSNIPGQDCLLNWNNPDWTQKGWDLIVPSATYTQVWQGGGWVPCDPVQIDSFVVWLDVRPVEDTGFVWFADAELYLNPG